MLESAGASYIGLDLIDRCGSGDVKSAATPTAIRRAFRGFQDAQRFAAGGVNVDAVDGGHPNISGFVCFKAVDGDRGEILAGT